MKNPHEPGPEMPGKPEKPDYELPDKPPPPVPEIDVPMGPGTRPDAPEIKERPEAPEQKSKKKS